MQGFRQYNVKYNSSVVGFPRQAKIKNECHIATSENANIKTRNCTKVRLPILLIPNLTEIHMIFMPDKNFKIIRDS
jgi:hypothetical protein